MLLNMGIYSKSMLEGLESSDNIMLGNRDPVFLCKCDPVTSVSTYDSLLLLRFLVVLERHDEDEHHKYKIHYHMWNNDQHPHDHTTEHHEEHHEEAKEHHEEHHEEAKEHHEEHHEEQKEHHEEPKEHHEEHHEEHKEHHEEQHKS